MDTLDLDKKVTARGFLGAFAYDEIPQRTNDDHFSLIVNTSPSSESGDHWLAIVYDKETFYFIDSYGRKPNDATLPKQFSFAIRKYIGENRMKYNSKWLQQLTSNACGDYCVYFLQEFEKVGFKRLLRVFSQNLKKNDKFVLNYVKKLV
jgi:hypothetical protein